MARWIFARRSSAAPAVDAAAALAERLVSASPPGNREGLHTPEQLAALESVRSLADIEALLPAASGAYRADLHALEGDLHFGEGRFAEALEDWQLASALVPTDLALLANVAEALAALGATAELAAVARTWRQLGGDPVDLPAFDAMVEAVDALAVTDEATRGRADPPRGRVTLR
jgi:predicted Zn-dependent protease